MVWLLMVLNKTNWWELKKLLLILGIRYYFCKTPVNEFTVKYHIFITSCVMKFFLNMYLGSLDLYWVAKFNKPKHIIYKIFNTWDQYFTSRQCSLHRMPSKMSVPGQFPKWTIPQTDFFLNTFAPNAQNPEFGNILF